MQNTYTLGKKEKFKVLKPILEIKTKNLLAGLKGTRTLVPAIFLTDKDQLLPSTIVISADQLTRYSKQGGKERHSPEVDHL